MGLYKNILLAVDLHPNYDELTTLKAVEFAKECQATLYIMHAVDRVHAYGAAQGYQIIVEVEKQLLAEAKRSLSELSIKHGIEADKQIILEGPPKLMILEQAKKLNVDLIIVGGHGLHGISLILGSIADGVTHHAHCDVLAIREKQPKAT